MGYPFKKYRFSVEISGGTVSGQLPSAADTTSGIGGGFSEVSGFDLTYDVIEYRDGNSPLNTAIKMPGLEKYSNITLKWGMTESITFYNWVTESRTKGNNLEKCNVAINLMDDDGTTILATWELEAAWPCKYTGPNFNASTSELAFESVELCHQGIKRTK